MRFSEFAGRPNLAAAHAGPLTVTAAAATLASLVALHANTSFVLLKVETAAIRLTVNGTTPTTTKGFDNAVGSEILLSKAEAENAQVIRSTGADGALQVAQFIA